MEIPPLSVFFPGPPRVIEDDDNEAYSALPNLFGTKVMVGAILEEIPQGLYVRPPAEGEDITN